MGEEIKEIIERYDVEEEDAEGICRNNHFT